MSNLKINDVSYVGNIKTKVEIKNKSKLWLEVFTENLKNALDAMGHSIVIRAEATTPLKQGGLRSSHDVKTEGLETVIVFGGSEIKYAAYQERGMRADGTHAVKNYTTPGTGKRFLQKAAEKTLKEGIKKYLK